MLNLQHSTFPVLNTERLILRQLVPEYAVSLHALRSDPEVNRYLGRPISANVAEAVAFISKIENMVKANEGMYWVVTLAGDNDLIGTVCFYNYDLENNTIELGYELMPHAQGKGIMTEAVKKVIEYAFNQMNAKIINALPSADNQPSVALLQKLGFTIDDKLNSEPHTEAENMLAYSLKHTLLQV